MTPEGGWGGLGVGGGGQIPLFGLLSMKNGRLMKCESGSHSVNEGSP